MNFAQKFLYPINIMPTDRQVGVSRFSFKTSAGAACCGRDGMVDIPDLKSVGPCARVGSSPTARTNYH